MTKEEGDEDKLPIPAVSLGDAEKIKRRKKYQFYLADAILKIQCQFFG